MQMTVHQAAIHLYLDEQVLEEAFILRAVLAYCGPCPVLYMVGKGMYNVPLR